MTVTDDGRRSWRRPVLRVVGLLVLFVALTYGFLVNGFGAAPWDEWAGWERASEAMVLDRIEVDLVGGDSPALGLTDYDSSDLSVYDRLASPETLTADAAGVFDPYRSEIGGQAHFWSFVWRDLGCSSVSCLHLVGSALFAATAIAMLLGLGLVTSWGLAWAWLLTVAASPWMTYAARNLFWSPWLYFLPTLAAVGLVAARKARWRWAALGGVFVAFVVKYVGTGYHEFVSFTLLAAAVPLLAIAFRSRFAVDARRQVVNSALVLASSAIAMALVLVLHAQVMAGSVPRGLREIWFNTVLRRTYGDAASFDPAYAASLEASPLEVIRKYVWSDWSTDLLRIAIDRSGSVFAVSLGSTAFVVLIVVSCLVVLVRLKRGDWRWKRDAALLSLGFAIPVLWFVAAKGYSYVHTHLLFFLWYFLLVPALVYVPCSFGWGLRRLGGSGDGRADSVDSGKSSYSSEEGTLRGR